jgi:hypothetical protein
MSFYHDSTGVDPDAPAVALLPDGWYPFKIFDAEELESKKGNPMVLAKCQVFNDPRYPDQEVWHYVTFLPKDAKGAGISVHFRKCIGVPFGGNDLVDAEDWTGKRFMGKVLTEEYEGRKRNKIVEVSPMPKETAGKTAEPVAAGQDEEIPF